MNDQQIFLNSYRTPEESNVSGYVDYGQLLGTEIVATETTHELAQQLNARQTTLISGNVESRITLQIEMYTRQIREEQDVQPFLPFPSFQLDFQDTRVLMERFKRTPNRIYKHPLLFVLGYIMSITPIDVRMALALSIAQRTQQHWIRDVDIIRYFHLHQALQS